jgi:hypothetical protein
VRQTGREPHRLAQISPARTPKAKEFALAGVVRDDRFGLEISRIAIRPSTLLERAVAETRPSRLDTLI